jgi:general secretion pathway protein D
MGAKVGLAGSSRQAGGSAGSGGTIGNSVKILPLRYVAAAEMKRLLEPIASYGGVVRVDTSRNALLLSGTDQEIASIREAVSVFDVDIMKGMSFALVPVRGLDPDAVAENLTRIFASNAEGAMSGMVQFIPNKRLRSVLVISKQPEYLQQAKAWIQRLDSTAAGATKQFYTYSVRNRQAKDLVDVLNAMFSRETTGGESRSSRVARNDAPGQAPVSVADAGGQGAFSVVGGESRAEEFSSARGKEGSPVAERAGARVASTPIASRISPASPEEMTWAECVPPTSGRAGWTASPQSRWSLTRPRTPC